MTVSMPSSGFESREELWNYTTTHFNGERIEIKDGAHLDRLCRQFVFQSGAGKYGEPLE